MVQAGANVTLEECEDTLYQVLGKAQQLFAYLVIDETVPNKTDVCNFFFKADANKTDIVGHLCDKDRNILVQLVHASDARYLV